MRQQDLFRLPRKPWNAVRLVGPKAPLKPKHVWAIRQQLKTTNRIRDLALFNCALDAKLRASDLVRLRVSEIAPGGALLQRSTVIQQKTGRPRSQSPHASRSRLGSSCGATDRTIGYSRAAAGQGSTSAPDSTPAW